MKRRKFIQKYCTFRIEINGSSRCFGKLVAEFKLQYLIKPRFYLFSGRIKLIKKREAFYASLLKFKRNDELFSDDFDCFDLIV